MAAKLAGRVRVVGRADNHGVDLFCHLVEQLANVEILSSRRELRPFGVESAFVDVANGDNFAKLAGVVDVAVALAADADAGKVDRAVRLSRARAAEAADAVNQ